MQRKNIPDRAALIPILPRGEAIVWQKSLSAGEVASIEVSCALYCLTFRLGWLIVLILAGVGLAILKIEPSMAMVGLTGSAALLGTAILLSAWITMHDLIFSKEELYVVTNRRVIFIDQKSAKELRLDSTTLKLWNIPGFGQTGLLAFTDFDQPYSAAVFPYKDGAAELCTVLPEEFAARIKGRAEKR